MGNETAVALKNDLLVPSGRNNARFTGGTSALSLLGKLVKQEKTQEERVTIVRKGIVRQDLVGIWKKFGEGLDYGLTIYDETFHWARWEKYSAKDVEIFSLHMEKFLDAEGFRSKAGYFLSALVNAGKENEYRLHTGSLPALDRLGYMNTKSITITGDAGDGLGELMYGKKIVVLGDAGHKAAAHMGKGRIVVTGNVQDEAGHKLWGGRLDIFGNAGDGLGKWAGGGRILVYGNAGEDVCAGYSHATVHIFGEYGSLSGESNGKIYHKDRCIAGGYFPKWWQKRIDPGIYEEYKEPKI